MANRSIKNFAELLEAEGVTDLNSSAAKKTEANIQPQGKPDSLSLSIKAKNFLGAEKRAIRPVNAPAHSARKRKHDCQGNLSAISEQGSELASSESRRIAWETPLTPLNKNLCQ